MQNTFGVVSSENRIASFENKSHRKLLFSIIIYHARKLTQQKNQREERLREKQTKHTHTHILYRNMNRQVQH